MTVSGQSDDRDSPVVLYPRIDLYPRLKHRHLLHRPHHPHTPPIPLAHVLLVRRAPSGRIRGARQLTNWYGSRMNSFASIPPLINPGL